MCTRGRPLPQSLAQNRQVVHPQVPSDPGGPGFFRNAPHDADALQGFDDNPDLFTHPLAPFDTANAAPGSPAQRLQAGAEPDEVNAAPKPPPPTVETTVDVRVETTEAHELEVRVQVFKDGKFNEEGIAETKFKGQPVVITFPTANYDLVDGVKQIKSLTGKFMLKGNIKVQTLYGKDTKADDISHYGRGTTREDKKLGNVSLGFHESCHRADFLTLPVARKDDIPIFTIAVGDTETQYDDAVASFNTDWVAWLQGISDTSFQLTDEVGYTYSQMEADAEAAE